jgi:predicted ArsR family transcriptional regulator
MSVDDPWAAMTALVDPSRRALYDYVRRAGHPVGREEAGEATGMSRGLAAFHLDKLVDAGLLRARYQAPPDQPRGRGRSPKVYETTGDGVAVSLPDRRYQLLAEILAAAVDGDPHHADQSATMHARRRGRTLGAALAARHQSDPVGILTELGFEPRATTESVLLRNCPFQALATRHTRLVCGLNHAFLTGLMEGLGNTNLQTRLASHPGRCCVELTPVAPRAAAGRA